MARKRYKISYTLGSCIAVPLQGGGFARGLVARMDGKGCVFGYFFGPRIDNAEDLSVDPAWRPDNAVFRCRFGDLGLVTNEWKVLGPFPNLKPEDWPMPDFVYYNDDKSMAFIRRYDERTFRFVGEMKIPAAEASDPTLTPDGLWGSGAVEAQLTALLKKPWPSQGTAT